MLLGVNTINGLRQCRKRLTAQQVKILRRIRRLADLEIVARRELQKPFDARARVFGTLALVAVRQQQNHARKQIPFVFPSADELIDHCLRHIDEIAELRLPEDERFWIIAAVTVFESEHAGFGKRGIVNFAARLSREKYAAAERTPAHFRYRAGRNAAG